MKAALFLAMLGLCSVEANEDAVVAYIESCRKTNGAFGPIDQDYTDVAWNYPAVAALHVLGREIENPDAIAAHGLGSPKGHVGHGHWRFFQQHQTLQLLDVQVKLKHNRVRVTHQGFEVRYYGSPFGTDGDTFFNAGSKHLDPRDSVTEELGYYNLSSLHYLLAGLDASGREASNPDELIDYVLERQAPSGGFVDVRVSGRKPLDSEVSISHTFFAVAILAHFGEPTPMSDGCIAFLQRELENSDDLYQIHAALSALELLRVKPDSNTAIAATIRRARNVDGGFGDRPDWPSRLYSTYWAVDSLRILGAEIGPRPNPQPDAALIEDDNLQIFQALMKTPEVAPADLAGLQKRGLNLLGLKSTNAALVNELRRAIADQQLPMDVVLCPEMYPHRATRPGGLELHHIFNATVEDTSNLEQPSMPWPEYVDRVITPTVDRSLVYPEQDFEMDIAFDIYENGYNAFLAGFNWAPSDFVRVFPWRERYVQQLPAIADADSHGDLEKWSEHLDYTRNLYLAEDPSYASFLDAAKRGRLVCVIAPRDGKAVAYYGRRTAVEFVKARENVWRWW